MGAKKKPGRFTLQFNLEDPQQQTVSDLLEQQGRRKAQFLTSAVLCYMQHSEQHINTPSSIDEQILERMLLSIMKKYPQFEAALSGELARTEKPPAQMVPGQTAWDSPVGDDTMKAISETLAAFQQR